MSVVETVKEHCVKVLKTREEERERERSIRKKIQKD